MADLVAVDGVVPPDRSADRPRVRIEEELVRIEAMPLPRLVRSVHAVAVEAARPDVGEVGVPQEVGPVRERDALGLDGVVRPVEEAEVDAGRVLGEQGEVDALAVPRGALRVRRSRPDPDRHEARDPSSRSVHGPEEQAGQRREHDLRALRSTVPGGRVGLARGRGSPCPTRRRPPRRCSGPRATTPAAGRPTRKRSCGIGVRLSATTTTSPRPRRPGAGATQKHSVPPSASDASIHSNPRGSASSACSAGSDRCSAFRSRTHRTIALVPRVLPQVPRDARVVVPLGRAGRARRP